MSGYTHKLSFSADHPSADLSELPVKLGMSPKRLWKVGEPRVAPNGRVIGGNHRSSYCSIEFESSPEGLPTSLRMSVEKLSQHKQLLDEFSKVGVNFRFFIGWFSEFNSEDRLDWQLLSSIAALKISLDFDFYGPQETQQIEIAP